MARKDILIDTDNDELLGPNGEYIEGDSAAQEAWLAMYCTKGANRMFPAAGFGIVSRIRKRVGMAPWVENPVRFKRDLKIELETDGHISPEIDVTNDLSTLNIRTEA